MNSNKLSKEQADLIITKSLAEISSTKARLGATITKYMTLKQLSNIISEEKDIFFVKDDELAKEMFLKYCCDNEEIKE